MQIFTFASNQKHQGEMTICDMENFSHIEKECKIIYRK
jgi:hypothetical protein